MADVTIDKVLKFYKSCLEKIPETIENAIYSNEKAILQLQKNQIYDGDHGCRYSATEHGMIIGFANVRADLTYQQGVPKMFLRSTRLS